MERYAKTPRPRTTASPKRKRDRGALSSATRERILESATRLFAKHGFESASMPAIAEAADITAGAIYRHFDNKAELLLEVVKRALRSLPLSVRFRGGDRSDASMLPRLLASYTDREMKLVRQLSLEVHAAASRDKDVRKLLSDYDEATIRAIRDIISAAQREGKIASTLDGEFTSRAVASFVMGLTHMDTLHPHLVGDRAWRDFVADRVAALLGIHQGSSEDD